MSDNKVSLYGLIAIVVGSIIGGGLFNLPSNTAQNASVGGALIAWLITGVGIYALAMSFQYLANLKPELDAGIYEYAKEAFGRYVGFNSAWGYFLSAAVGNVSFIILTMEALDYFFPSLDLKGNSINTIIGGSIIIWSMSYIISRGVKGATSLNIISTASKMIPILIFLIALIITFEWGKLTEDFWGVHSESLGDVSTQVTNIMLVTLWTFVGIEGAVVIGGRARTKRDVGRATLIGFSIALTINIIISILSFGIDDRTKLEILENPSMAYVFENIVGTWGAAFINIGLILSVMGALLAWLIMTVEVAYTAAKNGVLPKIFTAHNRHGAPIYAIIIDAAIMQITLIMVFFEKNSFLEVISIAGTMIAFPYLFSGIYLFIVAKNSQLLEKRKKMMTSGAIATIFSIFLLYSSGAKYLLLISIFYAVGILFYYKSHKESGSSKPLFKKYEMLIATLITLLAITAIALLITGRITL